MTVPGVEGQGGKGVLAHAPSSSAAARAAAAGRRLGSRKRVAVTPGRAGRGDKLGVCIVMGLPVKRYRRSAVLRRCYLRGLTRHTLCTSGCKAVKDAVDSE